MLCARVNFQRKPRGCPHVAPLLEPVYFDKEDLWNKVSYLFCFALLFKSMTVTVDRCYEPLSEKRIVLGRDGW